MRYRKLTASGDYSFGQGNRDFLYDIEAVAQAIKTRFQLYKGAFWRDVADGLPLFQNILPSPGSPNNLLAVDNILKRRVLGTRDVEGLTFAQSSFNPDTRQYIFACAVQTAYSTSPIEIQETL